MKATYINYSETHSFSPTLIRYLDHDSQIDPFISYPPTLDGFQQLLENKKVLADRETLVKVLKEQYSRIYDLKLQPSNIEFQAANLENESSIAPFTSLNSNLAEKNIELLALNNTYTITTGHQLNIFTGPLYFIYKIVTAIKLATELKARFPDKNFVPIYWMASEDHDFEEINHTFLGGKKIRWNHHAQGATGRLEPKDISRALKEYTGVLGHSPNAEKLTEIIETAYLKHLHLADATRYLVNALFEDFGLVILDADHRDLKKQFSAIIEDDIIQQNSFKNIGLTNQKLEEIGIEPQVNAREINFFYLLNNLRERIIFEDNLYKVLGTGISFGEKELRQEIKDHPERFSPNVVMRPLYQEVILPNMAYVGGGAEVIYWLQLKQNFDSYKVDFPILILRNSALIAYENLESKLKRLDLEFKDIFKKTGNLQKEWILNHTTHTLSLENEWNEINPIFEKLKSRAHQIDPTLGPSTEAVKARLHKAILNLEKKLIKAEKRNHTGTLSQIESIRDKLFPQGGLQERTENFGLFYVKHGADFLPSLMEHFKPLEFKFTILS